MKAGIVVIAGLMASATQAQNCKRPDPFAPWMLVQTQTLSEEDGAWRNDSLRKVLLTAANMKSGAVEPQLGWMLKVDDVTPLSGLEALDYLRQQVAAPGAAFPNRSTVGIAGMRATFFLVQRDTALLRAALQRMIEAGPREAIKPDMAVLEDRVRIMSGREQLYGTQMAFADGRYVPLAIEDSARVDQRRKSANLPPLAWSVCNANSK
jgi:hypothetical protein